MPRAPSHHNLNAVEMLSKKASRQSRRPSLGRLGSLAAVQDGTACALTRRLGVSMHMQDKHA